MSFHSGAAADGSDEHFSNWDDGDEGGGEGGEGGEGATYAADADDDDFDPTEGVYTASGAYADDGSGDSLYDGDEGADGGEGIHTIDEGDEGQQQPGRDGADEEGEGEGEGEGGGVDPVEEAKMAALDAARQRALSKLRTGTSFAAAAGAVPAQAKPSFTSRSAAAAAAAAVSPAEPAGAIAAAPAPKGKSMRDRRKEAKDAKALQAAQRMPVAAAAAAASGPGGALSAKEQAKLDRAARFAPSNASAAASALAPPSHASFTAAGRSPSLSPSPSPSPEFGAPPAFIGGGGRGAQRSTASLMAMAMGGADDSAGAGGLAGDEEGFSADNYAPIVGQCMLMCPLEEQKARQESRDLSYFEVVPGTGSKEHGDVPLVDPSKAVKKYKRAAAAQTLHPKDVRPPAVLRQTMDYLVRAIMDRRDSPDPAPLPSFLVIYRFVSDRMRALRQDFACQGRRDALAIDCYETMVRFHVLTMFELGDVGNLEKFDPTPNMEKLSQTLTSLRHMFHDNYTTPTGAPFPTPNEAEMHSYRLLIDLDRRFATLYEELDKFDPGVKNSPIVQFCVQVYNAFRENNYARFFELARAAPYCHAVLLGLHFNKVRARALEVMSHAYRFFPFGEFVEALAFESNQHATDFLAFHGLETGEIPHTQMIAFKARGRGSFQHLERGATPFPQRNSWKIVGAKRPPLVSQAALQGVGRGEGLGLERFLPGSALASAAAASSSSSSSSLVRSRAMMLPRAQPLPPPSAITLPSFGNMGAASGSGFASAFGQQQQQQQPASSMSAFGLPTPQPMPQSSAFGGSGASGRPVFGSGAGAGPSTAAGSAFGGAGSTFEMPPPGSLDGVVSKPTKFNRGAVSAAGVATSTQQQQDATAAAAAAASLNPKATPFVPSGNLPAAGASASAAPASTTSAFGGSGFGSSTGFGSGGGAFGGSASTVGFGGFGAAFGNGQAAAAATTAGAAAASGSAFGASPAGSVFGSGASPAPATTAVSAFGRDAAPTAASAAATPLSSGFAPSKPSAAAPSPAPVATAPAFPSSFAATVAASASRSAAAPAAPAPASSTSALVPGQTAHIAGFQLPVAVPRAAAPSSVSVAAAPAAATAAVPPPHPRPPMSIQRAVAAAAASASASGAATAARAPVTVVAPSKPLKPVPTPAQTQEMFLASLRCYRRSLLRRGLRSWHAESAERTRVRAEAAAAQAVLERRADTFAVTKWFLRWHAGMVQHQRAQQRFMQAQAALHAPLSVHLAAKLPFKTRGASSQRLLAAPSPSGSIALVPSPGANHVAFVSANGVPSGLTSPLAKLQRMGIARGEMVLSGEEPFEQDEGPEYAQEEEQQYEEERSSGQLNFDEGEEEVEEWQYGANGESYEEGDGSYAEEDGTTAEYEEADQAAYAEGDEQNEDGYDEHQEEEGGDVAPMDQGEDEDEQPFVQAAASRSSAPASAASKASRGPLSPALRSPFTRAPAPRVSLHFTSPLTPLRNGGMGVGAGSSGVGSHKRSRQSIEVDRFLAQFVSPSRRGVAGSTTPAAPAPTPAHPHPHPHAHPVQQPAAVFDSDANHVSLYDESEGEEEHAGAGRSGRRSTTRFKLFHTPSHATPRAVFTSPASATAAAASSSSSSASAYARSAFDVSAALEAASADSPSTYFKARPSYTASPAASLAAAAAASDATRPRDLVQQVQSELRQSSKLDELMQQLEFRYGAQL